MNNQARATDGGQLEKLVKTIWLAGVFFLLLLPC
jgi:hypothetical protein